MPEPTGTESKRGLWSPTTIIASFFAVGMLYFLSPLPVLYVVIQFDARGNGWMETVERPLMIYLAPLTWLYNNVPGVMQFYDWYLGILN